MRANSGQYRQVSWGLRWMWGLCLVVAVLLWGAAGTRAANQVTAIYLSPQDPDYFAAGGRPVGLYRYRLEFFPESEGDAS